MTIKMNIAIIDESKSVHGSRDKIDQKRHFKKHFIYSLAKKERTCSSSSQRKSQFILIYPNFFFAFNHPIAVIIRSTREYKECFDGAANLEGNVPTSTFIGAWWCESLFSHRGRRHTGIGTNFDKQFLKESISSTLPRKGRREGTSPPCTIDKSIGRNCTKLIKLLDGPWRSLTVNESWSVTLRPEHTRWQIVIGVTKRAFHP